jgi:hypothetical protein
VKSDALHAQVPAETAPGNGNNSPETWAMLDSLQKTTFDYFIHEVNVENGLVMDKTSKDSPASIAATGLALTAYPIGVERGFMEREEAVQRTLTTLRFFWHSPQGREPDATGHRGFYYHFLDMKSGRRVWQCELSTIDTTLFLAGVLAAAQYFERDDARETEIRNLAEHIYRRVDWRWAQNGDATVTHGWKPESGFLHYRWEGYSEALLLYILGLGSPTHPLDETSYAAFTSTYAWKEAYGSEYLYAGPLFIHQFASLWIDLRHIQDDFVRQRGIDYFENSCRATHVHQRYMMHNPQQFTGHGEHFWGLTASDGPGPATLLVDGIERVFYGYVARGAPYGPDDGTIAPWVTVASLPFAPEIVIPTIHHYNELDLKADNPYGYKATFNPTFPDRSRHRLGWTSPYHYGINQGPIVIAIENYRSGFVWQLMKGCLCVVQGLRRAGFREGWLS